MGKSFRNKNKNKQQRAAEGENGVAKPDEKKKDNKLMNYVKVVAKENAEFEKYYKFQNLCDDEAEHAVFMEHCRMALPTGLRVNGVMGAHADIVKKQFHDLLSLPGKPAEAVTEKPAEAAPAETDGEQTAAESSPEKAAPAVVVEKKPETKEEKIANAYVLKPEILNWYPNELAMQFNYLDAKSIKKDENFKFLKQFLMNREQYGSIQRQETVSMIPPIFLDVQPSDLVLDMCAAPGSKTCQLLEMIHWNRKQADNKFQLSEGAVVANDLEWKRANMLQHQVARIGSPGSAVLNTDAKYFAALKREDGSQLQFDKVLCDVPCSGDGTVRKTPNIWRTWSINDGMGLHFLQLQILVRGFGLLRPGGRLVYSTCSLNPMENESVIHAALLKLGKSVRVVAPPALDGMKAKEGKTQWGVCHPKNSDERYAAFADVPEDLTSKSGKGIVRPSMFCPAAQEAGAYAEEGAADGASAALYTKKEVLAQLPLCRRFLPHLMNTGGFFVTVLEKVSENVPSTRDGKRQKWDGVEKSKAQPPAAKKQKVADGSASPTKEGGEAAAEAPAEKKAEEKDGLVHLTRESEDWAEIQRFYELPDAAFDYFCKRPKVNSDTRIFGMSKKLKQVMDIVLTQNSTKTIACGVRCFEKLNNFGGCSWRITQEAIPLLLGLGMQRRVVKVSTEFLRYCLETRDMLTWAMLGKELVAPYEDNGKPKDAKALKAEANALKAGVPVIAPEEVRKMVNSESQKVEQGTYLLHDAESDLYAVVLVTQKNFTLYVKTHEAQALLYCMGVKRDLVAQMGLK